MEQRVNDDTLDFFIWATGISIAHAPTIKKIDMPISTIRRLALDLQDSRAENKRLIELCNSQEEALQAFENGSLK
jgi:hypothetical protein